MARLLADADRIAGTPAVYNSSAILHDTNHLRGLSAMRNLYHSLLLVIATATQKELARHIRFLKAENEILRSKLPAQVPVTAKEKHRLVRFAEKLGRALDQLTTIVHPDTLRRWIRESKSAPRPSVKGDGKRTAVDLRKLILRMARENPGWGYTRIVGELKKLGITPPSRGTVRNILREHGLDPAPTRGDSTWDEFLKLHAATLWQADFLSVRSLTAKGVRDLFLVVFLHVETRRVFITPSTTNPTENWVLEQARAFVAHLPREQRTGFYVQHDRDAKFSAAFDDAVEATDGKVVKTPVRSPNLQAFVERFHQTLRREVLDHFILFWPTAPGSPDKIFFGILSQLPSQSGHGQSPSESTAGETIKVPEETGRPTDHDLPVRRSLRKATRRTAEALPPQSGVAPVDGTVSKRAAFVAASFPAHQR